MAVALDDPTPCERCHGTRLVVRLPLGVGAIRPCPACSCCEICGKGTDTPPECGDCALTEDDAARRRADV
jgi:hypothetical protein